MQMYNNYKYIAYMNWRSVARGRWWGWRQHGDFKCRHRCLYMFVFMYICISVFCTCVNWRPKWHCASAVAARSLPPNTYIQVCTYINVYVYVCAALPPPPSTAAVIHINIYVYTYKHTRTYVSCTFLFIYVRVCLGL